MSIAMVSSSSTPPWPSGPPTMKPRPTLSISATTWDLSSLLTSISTSFGMAAGTQLTSSLFGTSFTLFPLSRLGPRLVEDGHVIHRRVRFHAIGNVNISGEFHDHGYSHGNYLSRLDIQSVIKMAVTSQPRPLPLDVRDGLYLILTSGDLRVQDFCRAVFRFHYFTFLYIVGATVPYAWVGYIGSPCPGTCAYLFAWPRYSGRPPPSRDGMLKPPNGDAGVDGMISVIAHNPPRECLVGRGRPDLCMGVYRSGAGGGFIGAVNKERWGDGFNLNGVNGRKFLVQWVWSPVKNRCYGPNAIG